MATMLSFVTTDADIEQACLQKMLSVIAMDTYNMMSVDGDMSTNDTVLVLANGMAGNEKITEANIDAYTKFFDALYFVNAAIVKSIVKKARLNILKYMLIMQIPRGDAES